MMLGAMDMIRMILHFRESRVISKGTGLIFGGQGVMNAEEFSLI